MAFFARLGLNLRPLVLADAEPAAGTREEAVERPQGLLPAVPKEAS